MPGQPRGQAPAGPARPRRCRRPATAWSESLEQLGAEPERGLPRSRWWPSARRARLASTCWTSGRSGRRPRRPDRAATRAAPPAACATFCAVRRPDRRDATSSGLPVRYPWAQDYRGSATVLYGHTPVADPVEWVNGTAVPRHRLRSSAGRSDRPAPPRARARLGARRAGPLRPPPARWTPRTRRAVPRRLGATPSAAPSAVTARREPDRPATSTDVLGNPRGGDRPRTAGSRCARRNSPPAALEVMSRFATDPRWLLLPAGRPRRPVERPPKRARPARAPRAGVQRLPRRPGSAQVLCEEKHMGSRAVALVCARRRRGAGPLRRARRRGLGAVWTRTGRLVLRRRPRRPRRWCSAGCDDAARARRALRAELSSPTGCCWTPSCCPWSAEGRRRCCASSTPPVAAAGRARRCRPTVGRAASGPPRSGLDVADLPGAHPLPGGTRRSRLFARRLPALLLGPPTAWTAWRLAPFAGPRGPGSPDVRRTAPTPGTSTSPTASSRRTPACCVHPTRRLARGH